MTMLKAQDLVLSLYLRCHRQQDQWTYASLAEQAGMTASQCFASVKRCRASMLLSQSKRAPWSVSWLSLRELLAHALRFMFPAEFKASARGWPTVHSAAFVKQHFLQDVSEERQVVWPDKQGPVKGDVLLPLHKSVCKIISKPDEQSFYNVMATVDLLRVGQARERDFAMNYLEEQLA